MRMRSGAMNSCTGTDRILHSPCKIRVAGGGETPLRPFVRVRGQRPARAWCYSPSGDGALHTGADDFRQTGDKMRVRAAQVDRKDQRRAAPCLPGTPVLDPRRGSAADKRIRPDGQIRASGLAAVDPAGSGA